MLHATVGQTLPLQVFVPDGTTTLFARATITTSAGAPVNTLGLAHVGNGVYAVTWAPPSEGYFTVVYDLALDAGFTQDAGYLRDAEVIEVDSIKTQMLRLLGLHHENAVLDQQVYGVSGRMESARLRAYDTDANAQAAGSTGLLFTWSVLATYDSQNRSQTFKILRVP